MAERTVPTLALAWTDGEHPKRYASVRSAYYAIAKRMVIEKYPPTLDMPDDSPHWSNELIDARTEKMMALFYGRDQCFCSDRWRRFITRVAKFLAFVDSKRSPAEVIELRFSGLMPAETDAMLQAEYERAERDSAQLAEYASEIKRVIDARANR